MDAARNSHSDFGFFWSESVSHVDGSGAGPSVMQNAATNKKCEQFAEHLQFTCSTNHRVIQVLQNFSEQLSYQYEDKILLGNEMVYTRNEYIPKTEEEIAA